MALAAGTYRFGPENATLTVRTGRTGAAAKAGHDLLLHVTAWHATLKVAGGSEGSSLVLDVDATSMRVREGTGGMQALGDDDKANIEQTIDDEVLKGLAIGFRSRSVEAAADDGRLEVSGDLTLVGTTHPITFEVAIDAEGMLRGTAVVTTTTPWCCPSTCRASRDVPDPRPGGRQARRAPAGCRRPSCPRAPAPARAWP